MSSLANKDEAERARDLAKNALTNGQFEKAHRLSTRSQRLFTDVEVSSVIKWSAECTTSHCRFGTTGCHRNSDGLQDLCGG